MSTPSPRSLARARAACDARCGNRCRSIAREGIDEDDDAGADDDDDAVGRILPQVLCCFENNEQPWAGPLKQANTPLARAASREPGLREVAIGPAAAAAATETFCFAARRRRRRRGRRRSGQLRLRKGRLFGARVVQVAADGGATSSSAAASFAERAPPCAFYTCVHVERLRATSGLPARRAQGRRAAGGDLAPRSAHAAEHAAGGGALVDPRCGRRWRRARHGRALVLGPSAAEDHAPSVALARVHSAPAASARTARLATERHARRVGAARVAGEAGAVDGARHDGAADAAPVRGRVGARRPRAVHAVSPLQSWEMVLRIGGYEASAPLTVNRGGSTEARLNQKMPEVLELRSEGEGPRPKLRVYLQNRLAPAARARSCCTRRTGCSTAPAPALFREVRGVGAIKDVNIHAGRSHAMDGGADPKSAKQSRRTTRSGRASAAAASRSAKSSKAAATAASIDEEEGEEGGGVVAPADVTASLDSDDGAAAAAEAMATIDEAPPTLGAPKVAVAESATASDFDTESVGPSLWWARVRWETRMVSDSGRSEEEIDPFEGVSSREETDAPLLFGWAKGKDLFQGGGQVGGKDIFNRRMSIRWRARRLADARRPCGVQRPAPADGRPPPPHQSRPFSMDVVNTVGASAAASTRWASRSSAPPPALFEGRHRAALIIRNGLGGGMSLAYRQTLARGAAHARAGRRGRLPLAVAAVGGEDARARVGCERLGALLVVRAAAFRRRRGRRHKREHLLALRHGLPIDEVTDFILRLGEPPRELEVVSENQRRRTLFQPFEENGLLPTDYAGGWSDERVTKKPIVSTVWPPRGWECGGRVAGRLLGERRRGRLAIRDELAAAGPGAARSEVAREGGRVVVRPPPPLGAHAAARPHGVALARRRRACPLLARRAAAGERQRRVAVDGGGVAGGGGGGGALRERFVCVDVAMRGVGAGIGDRRARAAVPDRERHKPLAHAPPARMPQRRRTPRRAHACPTFGTRRRASGSSR